MYRTETADKIKLPASVTGKLSGCLNPILRQVLRLSISEVGTFRVFNLSDINGMHFFETSCSRAA